MKRNHCTLTPDPSLLQGEGRLERACDADFRTEQDVESPCVRVCVMHEPTGYCLGCYRTLDEIAAWGTLTIEQRCTALARLPEREKRVRNFIIWGK